MRNVFRRSRSRIVPPGLHELAPPGDQIIVTALIEPPLDAPGMGVPVCRLSGMGGKRTSGVLHNQPAPRQFGASLT